LGHENGVVAFPALRAFRELRARPFSHETSIVGIIFYLLDCIYYTLFSDALAGAFLHDRGELLNHETE
jgi:hypothetical protein